MASGQSNGYVRKQLKNGLYVFNPTCGTEGQEQACIIFKRKNDGAIFATVYDISKLAILSSTSGSGVDRHILAVMSSYVPIKVTTAGETATVQLSRGKKQMAKSFEVPLMRIYPDDRHMGK